MFKENLVEKHFHLPNGNLVMNFIQSLRGVVAVVSNHAQALSYKKLRPCLYEKYFSRLSTSFF